MRTDVYALAYIKEICYAVTTHMRIIRLRGVCRPMSDQLLSQLARELGEISCWEIECPGVYYLSVLSKAGLGIEYYAVLENAPVSQELRAMGRPLTKAPVLLYSLDPDAGVRAAVEYEVLKYKIQHGLPIPEDDSLREIALYGMEMCPDYFGAYPVPSVTPLGYTLRHCLSDRGIYWLETDQLLEVLAVCYPIWASELSEVLLGMAEEMTCEGEMGYRYFRKDMACAAIWELLRTRPKLLDMGLIREYELMNAIWTHHPQYAAAYNTLEQVGANDAVGLLLQIMGVESLKRTTQKHLISLVPGAGTDVIGFWK